MSLVVVTKLTFEGSTWSSAQEEFVTAFEVNRNETREDALNRVTAELYDLIDPLHTEKFDKTTKGDKTSIVSKRYSHWYEITYYDHVVMNQF